MEATEKCSEEERLLTVVDFDVLCSTVAMQAEKGKWSSFVNFNEEEETEEGFNGGGEGRGAFRMWEGEVVSDCFDDHRIALESTCCPCYRFGKNMKRAGSGSCLFQGVIYMIVVVIALLNLLAFAVTKKHYFLYLAIAFTISIGAYLGFRRTQIRKKFNIRGSDSLLDDFIYHLACPCCTLCQETRTLEMNNVQDGIWHGRGDTVCIGNYSVGSKTLFGLNPPPMLSINPSDLISPHRTTNDSSRPNTSDVANS